MTYAITLVKCEISKRNEALELLTNLKKQKDPFGNKVRIKEFYISFGWPDFVLFCTFQLFNRFIIFSC